MRYLKYYKRWMHVYVCMGGIFTIQAHPYTSNIMYPFNKYVCN